MPSTYTSNLGIELPADGEIDGVWGDVVNDNMNILDRGINGVLSLSLSGTTSTLTTSDGALSDGQYKLLLLTGSPSGTHTITLSPNDAQKIYFVRNTTAQSVIFTQGSGGNVTIATGDSGIIYSNGAGAGAAIANLTDHFAMSSVNITGGSITGLADLSLSAANPSITFLETDTTDTDARIRLNAGDLLFETVTDAGAQVRENMRIESGGNVGIGTTNPVSALEVSSNTNPTAAFIAYISGTTMTVTGITSGALAVGDRVFGAGVEWNTVITAQLTGTTGSSGTYSVNNSQTVSTAPTGIAMDSSNAGKSVLRLTNTDTTEAINQTTGAIEFYGSDATAGAGVKGYVAVIAEDTSPDSAMIFGTSDDTSTAVAVERMRIDSTGNVGIGTSAPAAKLDIAVNSSSDAVRINQTGAGNALVVEDSANPDSTPLVITGAGEVGIGVSAPTVKLDVAGAVNIALSSANAGLTITQTGAGNAIFIEDQTSPDSTPFVITATGSVGIGTDSPATKLSVVGSATVSGDLTVDTNTLFVDAGNNYVGIGTLTPSATLHVMGGTRIESDSPILILAESDTTNTDARLRVQAGSLLFETVTDAGVLVRENMQIGSGGNVTIDTNTLFVDASNNRVGVGTITPATTLEVVGSANFSATTTESRSLNVGIGRSGNGLSAVDLVGDATYTSYGLRVIRGSTGANTNSSILHRGTGTLILSAEDSAPMEFYTNGSRAMRIGNTQAITMDNLAGTGSRAVNASAAGVLSAASDSRLKEEVPEVPIPGLAEVMQLEPRAYKWLNDIEKRGENAAVEIGFFADQVKDIIPSAAPMGKDGYYGFYDRSVVAALTKAVQEQQAIIVALEARLTALETVR